MGDLQLFKARVMHLLAAAGAVAIAAAAFVGAGRPAAVHAAAPSIVQPTYVRTIGGATEAIMYPSGVAVDQSGNVFVANTGNDRVEKYQARTTNLVWSVGVRGAPIGPAGSGNDSFVSPRDVAVDATHVYVADTDDAMVQVLNASDGSFVQAVSSFGVSMRFIDPIGISVGTDGKGGERILVSDGVSGNVYVFDTSFNLQLTIPPTSPTEGTRDAATDAAGNIYTADYRGNAVDKYDSTDSTGSTPLATWGSSSTSDCHDVAKPYGIDIDTADTPNRVYVASSDLETNKVFDTSGNCLNVGTTGSNAIGIKSTTSSDSTGLFQLRRVAIGPGSNPLVYAADLWGLKILTYNSTDGTIASSSQPELGNGQYPPAGNLNLPHSIAVDAAANYVFAINTVNQRVERFNLDGSNPFNWGSKGVGDIASFNWAQGMAYDPANGNVWVANTRNNRIDEFTTSGTTVMNYPPNGRLNSIFNWPMAVAFDPAGNMYVADTYNNRVVAFSISGTTVTQLWSEGTSGSGTDQFNKPFSLVYDGTQSPARMLVADTNNGRVVSLNPTTGAWNSSQPTISQGSGPGFVSKPEGVTVDASGNIWVADTGNDRVEEFTPTGAFANQMIGSYGLTGNASFNAPQGIGFDNSSPQLLYVADTNNNRIQVYQPTTTSSACISAALIADQPSPQPIGATIKLTASSGGCAQPNYQFWLQYPNGTWLIEQHFSQGTTWTWHTAGLPIGQYRIVVWANQAGHSQASFEAWADARMTLTGCGPVSVTWSPLSQSPSGTTVTATATTSVCATPQFQFWALAPGSSTWQDVQPYGSGAGGTLTWNTSGKLAGTYSFSVWAKDAASAGASGNSLGRWDSYISSQYKLTTTPCSAVSVTSSPNGTAPAGTKVTISGLGATCSFPLYQFFMLTPGSTTWKLVQPYGNNASFVWSTTTGTAKGVYHFSVWVRDSGSAGTAGNSLGRWDAATAIPYTLT